MKHRGKEKKMTGKLLSELHSIRMAEQSQAADRVVTEMITAALDKLAIELDRNEETSHLDVVDDVIAVLESIQSVKCTMPTTAKLVRAVRAVVDHLRPMLETIQTEYFEDDDMSFADMYEQAEPRAEQQKPR